MKGADTEDVVERAFRRSLRMEPVLARPCPAVAQRRLQLNLSGSART